MSAIYDRFKAQEDSVEKRVDAEQRMEMETDARRAQEKEMKRVQVSSPPNAIIVAPNQHYCLY